MQTQCPACNTQFRVSDTELSQADGLVRCGRCGYIFNAHERLEKPASAESKAHSPEVLKRILLGKNNTEENAQASFGWMLGIVIFTVFLCLQLSYLSRDKLAEIPGTAPYVTALCKRISFCELKTKRDLSQIQLVSRNVYSHPNVEKALMVNAVITNNASFNQPFPVLLISMSNVRGQVVAERYFHPTEYLSTKSVSEVGMRPGVPIQINLALMDPGQNAIAFELDFI